MVGFGNYRNLQKQWKGTVALWDVLQHRRASLCSTIFRNSVHSALQWSVFVGFTLHILRQTAIHYSSCYKKFKSSSGWPPLWECAAGRAFLIGYVTKWGICDANAGEAFQAVKDKSFLWEWKLPLAWNVFNCFYFKDLLHTQNTI